MKFALIAYVIAATGSPDSLDSSFALDTGLTGPDCGRALAQRMESPLIELTPWLSWGRDSGRLVLACEPEPIGPYRAP